MCGLSKNVGRHFRGSDDQHNHFSAVTSFMDGVTTTAAPHPHIIDSTIITSPSIVHDHRQDPTLPPQFDLYTNILSFIPTITSKLTTQQHHHWHPYHCSTVNISIANATPLPPPRHLCNHDLIPGGFPAVSVERDRVAQALPVFLVVSLGRFYSDSLAGEKGGIPVQILGSWNMTALGCLSRRVHLFPPNTGMTSLECKIPDELG